MRCGWPPGRTAQTPVRSAVPVAYVTKRVPSSARAMPPTNASPRLGVFAFAGAGRVARMCVRPDGVTRAICRAKEKVR
jgi:hypothetical protein